MIMLKKISDLRGVQKLSKKQQLKVQGGMGLTTCNSDADCEAIGGPLCISACIASVGLCVFDTIACGPIGG